MAGLNNSFFRFPSTKLGKWAVGLAAVFVMMYVTHRPLKVFVFTRPDDPFSIFLWMRIWPPLFWWTWICGLLAIIVGLIALIIKHERSWLVCLMVIVSSLIFLYFWSTH